MATEPSTSRASRARPVLLVLLGVLAAAVLIMGIWPRPFIDVMHASVVDLLAHVARSKL